MVVDSVEGLSLGRTAEGDGNDVLGTMEGEVDLRLVAGR